MRQLEPKDAWFVYVDTPRFRQAYMSAFVLTPDDADGRLPDRAEITRWFEERAVLPLLRQRLLRVPLDLDHPYWVDDPDFAVDRHLHFHGALGWDESRTMVADLSTEPMDERRPLWELHVIEQVHGVPDTDGPAMMVVLKMHHAVTDGIGSAVVTTTLFGDALPPNPNAIPPQHIPGDVELVLRALGRVPRTVVDAVSAVRRARANWRALHLARADAAYPLPRQDRTPTPLDGPVGPRRVIEAVHFALPEVQEIKARIGGVTVNDLMLTVVGGAMRAYLVEQGHTPPGSLATSAPMTIRGTGTAAGDESNNKFVMMVVDLRTDIADPVARARAVHDAVLGERARLGVPAEAAVAHVDYMFPGWVFRAARRVRAWQGVDAQGIGRRPFNTFVSSVPREINEVRVAGTTCVHSFGIGPLDGTGTGHAVGAVGERLGMNVAADPDLLTDSRRYAELIRQSYTELRDAARQLSMT
ncbi:wax ester/triacylglycerol synthase domain-containing protein [Rhodococcus gannanensis]|uniref:diacylglycerol O-acyltransferase n=1 Tax=Rhodococcus gannanensis TaxID=1960308 RepID=A0ABW4PBP0_9NOCA